jgi:hypothetical protein
MDNLELSEKLRAQSEEINRDAAIPPLSSRHQLLSFLVERGMLNDDKHGKRIGRKGVFRAAATMPCDIHDLDETVLPLALEDIRGYFHPFL